MGAKQILLLVPPDERNQNGDESHILEKPRFRIR
jgi:hypothetical protein